MRVGRQFIEHQAQHMTVQHRSLAPKFQNGNELARCVNITFRIDKAGKAFTVERPVHICNGMDALNHDLNTIFADCFGDFGNPGSVSDIEVVKQMNHPLPITNCFGF
ncbi:MAG: hypothetical protein BGP07_09545 [Rhizobiales bacterium 63-22]|nr:MAG: hypothetical protein BGP07_09545 [Rhizobiales bacterium 63-22]